jgi:hypothetical protein
MAVPYTFGSATSSIPLSQLDSNFATGITLGNTTVYLGNTTTSFGNVSLTNVTISSVSTAITPAQGGTGLITIPANNVILGNGTSNVAVVAPGTSGNVLTSNGTTWSSSTISAASVSAAGSTTQVQYNNAGAFAGSANLTFNGTTLTAAGLSGPHNGTVGATTPGTGSFTTLAASSTVSGTGFSTYLASPPAIGGTAPAAGAFTTLTASTPIGTASGGTGLGGATPFTSGGVVYASSSSALATGSALTFDGNGAFKSTGSTDGFISSTFVNTSAGTSAVNRIQIGNNTSDGAGQIVVYGGNHSTLASVMDINNANNADLRFLTNNTERVRLTSSSLYTASGINVGFGTSSPNTKLQVNGGAVIGNGTIAAPASGFQLRITNDNTDYYDFGRNSSTGYFISNSSQASPYRGFIWAYGGTAQATLDASGNLGIATTTITRRLEVGNGAGDIKTAIGQSLICLSANSGNLGYVNEIGFGGSGATNVQSAIGNIVTSDTAAGNGALYFATRSVTTDTAPTERARIDSSGNLLVGTTSSPGAAGPRLYVDNTNNTSGDSGIFSLLGANCSNTSSAAFSALITGVGNKFYVYGNGNVVNTNNSYGAISDVKFKENIVDATPKLNDVLNLKVRNFNLKTEPNNKQIGFIAQEFEEVFPAMIDVSPDTDVTGKTLETTHKSIKLSVLVPILVKAIQEQQAMIESLRQRLSAANL